MENITGYPLLKVLNFENKVIILKSLPFSEERLQWLEVVYNRLSFKENLSSPIKNIENKYISKVANECFILFEFYENSNCTKPSAEWWANTLFNVHNIQINTNKKITQDFTDTKELFINGSRYMSNKISSFVSKLNDQISLFEKKSYSLILNHGDPLDSNVMKYNNNFILMDFENSFLAPKEYDIQRHLCDYVIHSNSSENFREYCRSFIDKYEDLGGKIDLDMLIYLFKLDFCRTISWLHIVVQDRNRKDFKRQNEDLKMFLKAIENSYISNMIEELRAIKKESYKNV